MAHVDDWEAEHAVPSSMDAQMGVVKDVRDHVSALYGMATSHTRELYPQDTDEARQHFTRMHALQRLLEVTSYYRIPTREGTQLAMAAIDPERYGGEIGYVQQLELENMASNMQHALTHRDEILQEFGERLTSSGLPSDIVKGASEHLQQAMEGMAQLREGLDACQERVEAKQATLPPPRRDN